MESALSGDLILDRMVRAVELVRARMLRTAAALGQAGIPYAIVGGNAVAAWVATVDPAAVRNTQDVDILIRRRDLPAVVSAMESAGFIYRHSAEIDMFLDGPGAKVRDAVHVVFAGEKVRKEYVEPAPDVSEAVSSPPIEILSLGALVRMKLNSFRRKDQVHIQDMIGVGLVDDSWPGRLTPVLSSRLKEILENPEG